MTMGSGVTQATIGDAWDWENPLDPDDANALPMDALSLFWHDVEVNASETHLLSRDDERALMRRARLGDKTARQALVLHNLRLVGHMARLYATSYQLPLADALQEGAIGLMRAAAKCDERKNVTFSTYAWLWIRQAMQRARVDQRAGHIKVPVREVEAATRHYHLTGENLVYDRPIASLDKPLMFRQNDRGEDDSTLYDVLTDSADELGDAETRIDTHDVRALLARMLSPREAQVVTLRLGLDGSGGLKLGDVGARLVPPITRERVRQLYERAMRKLRAVAPDLWPDALTQQLRSVLDDRAARIVVMHLGLGDAEPMTYAAIGRKVDLSRQRVRQLYISARKKLRTAVPDLWPEHAGRKIVRATPKPAPRPMKLQKAG